MNQNYEAAGVHYELLDAGKRAALRSALATSVVGQRRGLSALDESRGESAFVFDFGGQRMALVLECLGTKSSLAREYQATTGVDRFDWVGFDTVAAIVNDLCSTGAIPLVVNAYFATGTPEWYEVKGRFDSLVAGFRAACEQSGSVWGGGESPMLNGIISSGEIDLAGSAVGYIPPTQEPLLGSRVAPGHEIVLVASTGLHTNGASLARRAAEAAGGLGVTVGDDTLGDALLRPSALYVSMLQALYDSGADVSYASHITGHGLRKVMRSPRELTYRIDHLLPVPDVLQFIVDTLHLPADEAYGTLNMGNGFALFCPAGSGGRTAEICRTVGHPAEVCGVVEEGPRQVILSPLGITYGDQELQLRPE